MAMADSPSDLDAYREALATAIAAVEAAKFNVIDAIDDIELARDALRRLFGTSSATSIFNNPIADAHLAARALDDALDDLPVLPETEEEREEATTLSAET
jgi:hypothetical protein